jgi:3-deoxy-D-manno-octulosonate 8-phosphate phosphatase (KDO 8-P phosphatase)
MKHSPALLKRAKKIRLLATDVDGVLTRGEIILLNSGEEIKIWSVADRMGFALLRLSGLNLPMAWITARGSKQVEIRAKELGVKFLVQKSTNKWTALEGCLKALNIRPEEAAFIGDDFVDIPALKRAGLAVAPKGCHPLVKKHVHIQTEAGPGEGVAREVIELLLKAQGAWHKAIRPFLSCLILAFMLSGCWNSLSQTAASEKPDQWMENFTITETQSGVPKWVLNSRQAEVYQKKKIVSLLDVQISFLNPPAKRDLKRKTLAKIKQDQTASARMVASKGEVNIDNHDLNAWGGVQITSDDGTVLYTEKLNFSNSRQKIYTDAAVKIVRKDSIVLGEGMEANPDLSNVRIFQHEASIFPKEVLNR